MTQATIRPLGGRTRFNWIRLRTIILLRWVAIIGQVSAISAAQMVYGLQLNTGLCYLVIGVSVIGNLIATLAFPKNRRLSERENLAMVMFDLLQLSVLLYLTGGLHNPFAVLLLGPVTTSANSLGLRSTIVLCGTAIVAVTLIALDHLPLVSQTGSVMQLPEIFVFGHWVALIIAIVFISAYSRRVTDEIHSMSDALAATQMALSREQKLTDLGGVVAAAAHELGTPLATIKLTSTELMQELRDNPELAEDAQLIREQTDRCSDILRDMGRAGKDDMQMHHAPIVSVMQEAAEPHTGRGKNVEFLTATTNDGPQPIILRKPEIIHGLRNLIQNAVDFATLEVKIKATWSDKEIRLRILDDGHGFPPQILDRIGDPFMRQRTDQQLSSARPYYEGMGLGLFIAKTLLERSGASLRFANAQNYGGAIVEVQWPRKKLESPNSGKKMPLGDNKPITS